MDRWSSYETFFHAATGNEPYEYQRRLATADVLPHLMRIPTGAGKTLAVALAWLWRRRFHPDVLVRRATPRRLIYCLPMRVLVEQTRNAIAESLGRVGLLDASHDPTGLPVGVYTVMGGEVDEEWFRYPERDSIIIGTQDMLLSRALNRGYALGRFSWPIAFGLLNNDVLWVLDEVQLMGAGLPTTAQLDAFRAEWGTLGPTHTIWMSATLRPQWLQTVDHPAPAADMCLELSPQETQDERLRRRLTAQKVLRQLPLEDVVTAAGYARTLAAHVLQLHRQGTLTLVILNTVPRARAVYEALSKMLTRSNGSNLSVPAVDLLHSRFRAPDREKTVRRLDEAVDPAGPGRILVSTQVVEAGVDISAATLVTELAPWPNLVQRFGRCNRDGLAVDAHVWWVDIPDARGEPYAGDDLHLARELLLEREVQSVHPLALPDPELDFEEHHVLRRKDFIELFDTNPDLSGNDVDVSRFIRDVETVDVRVAWRRWDNRTDPPAHWPRLHRDELCPVPLFELIRFLHRNQQQAWTWDHLARAWTRIPPDEIRPGMTVVLRAEAGGYAPALGWTGTKTAPVPVDMLQPTSGPPETSAGDDPDTFRVGWETLQDHTQRVVDELTVIVDGLRDRLSPPLAEHLIEAAWWHDIGKAHPVFQETLKKNRAQGPPEHDRAIWAKSPDDGQRRRHSRPHFRHELASLLALWQPGSGRPTLDDLTLYLIAAHHGRIRLGIRSFPGREGLDLQDGPRTPDQYVLGIQDGDVLPRIDLGNGRTIGPIELWPSLLFGTAHSGQRSWLARTLQLRDATDLGPFRLALLEAILRAADVRASMRARGGDRHEAGDHNGV